MSAGSRVRAGAVTLGRVVLVFLGWCLVMAIYSTTYDQFQRNAVPVTVAPWRDFSLEQWDGGYFDAKGSLHTDNAEDQGDRQVLGTTDITCIKSANNCTIATADIFNGNMHLDTTDFDIDRWDAQQITFHDDSSICMNNSYVIDRAAQTFVLIARKKAVIPDYAIKSPLHPCDNLKDRHISLVRGSEAFDQEVQIFQRHNSLWLHLYLVALNAAYFALVIWSERRRQQQSMILGGAS